MQEFVREHGFAYGGKRLQVAYKEKYGYDLETLLGTNGVMHGVIYRIRSENNLPAPPRGRPSKGTKGSSGKRDIITIRGKPKVRSGKYSRIDPADQINHGGLLLLKGNNPALAENRTIFPTTVRHPFLEGNTVFKTGKYNCKTGDRVVKGRWKGFPIFSLTLEERATCPVGCHMRRGCMGNGMHRAVRYRHGRMLEHRLEKELSQLNKEHPKGFVIRLHILGDFYSVDYVKKWEQWLRRFPALNVFGYTNWQPYPTEFDSPEIGRALEKLRRKHWSRFAIRFSRAVAEDWKMEAITIPSPEQASQRNSILCPLTTGATKSCGTCTLCWEIKKNILFVHHGSRKGRKRNTETDA